MLKLAYLLADFVVDAVLVLLAVILVYLLHSRGYIRAFFFPHRVESSVELKSEEGEKEAYVKRVRERRKAEIEGAKREQRKLEHMQDEAKKRLMKGEIDSATFREVLMDVHKGLIEVEARIKTLEGD